MKEQEIQRLAEKEYPNMAADAKDEKAYYHQDVIDARQLGYVKGYTTALSATPMQAPQPLKRLDDITDSEMLELAAIVLDMPFQKYKTGWKVSRDFAITGWPYIRVSHPKNVYRFEMDCTLINFNVYNMEDTVTAEHDMKPVQCIDFLRSKGYLPNPHPIPVDNWIAVSDRLPENPQSILFIVGNSKIVISGWFTANSTNHGHFKSNDGGWYYLDTDEPAHIVTHWQPLPNPPQQ